MGSAIYFAAILGLSGLLLGLVLVNIVSTPRSAQIGGLIAGIGVVLLAIVAGAFLVMR